MALRHTLRRRGLLASLFCMLCAGIGAAVAQPVPQPASETPRLEAIRARGALRVCIWPDYFAISYRNPRNSEMEGIDIDMARALAQRLGVRLDLVDTSFAEFMDRLAEHRCDIAMFGVGVTAARAARVDFSTPYLISRVYGVASRDNRRLRSWVDIDQPGVVVAVAAGTVMEPLMRGTLRQAELLVVRPPQTREAELQSGRADVFMSDYPYTRRMVLMHDWVRIIDPPGPIGETVYAYAVAKGDPAWLAEVNAFLVAARADGTLARAAEAHRLTPIVAP